jgi:hypothetical protein
MVLRRVTWEKDSNMIGERNNGKLENTVPYSVGAQGLEMKLVPLLNVQEQAFWSDVDLHKHACSKGTV